MTNAVENFLLTYAEEDDNYLDKFALIHRKLKLLFVNDEGLLLNFSDPDTKEFLIDIYGAEDGLKNIISSYEKFNEDQIMTAALVTSVFVKSIKMLGKRKINFLNLVTFIKVILKNHNIDTTTSIDPFLNFLSDEYENLTITVGSEKRFININKFLSVNNLEKLKICAFIAYLSKSLGKPERKTKQLAADFISNLNTALSNIE